MRGLALLVIAGLTFAGCLAEPAQSNEAGQAHEREAGRPLSDRSPGQPPRVPGILLEFDSRDGNNVALYKTPWQIPAWDFNVDEVIGLRWDATPSQWLAVVLAETSDGLMFQGAVVGQDFKTEQLAPTVFSWNSAAEQYGKVDASGGLWASGDYRFPITSGPLVGQNNMPGLPMWLLVAADGVEQAEISVLESIDRDQDVDTVTPAADRFEPAWKGNGFASEFWARTGVLGSIWVESGTEMAANRIGTSPQGTTTTGSANADIFTLQSDLDGTSFFMGRGLTFTSGGTMQVTGTAAGSDFDFHHVHGPTTFGTAQVIPQESGLVAQGEGPLDLSLSLAQADGLISDGAWFSISIAEPIGVPVADHAAIFGTPV